MADNPMSDFFLNDADDDVLGEDDELIVPAVIVPPSPAQVAAPALSSQAAPPVAAPAPAAQTVPAPQPVAAQPVVATQPAPSAVQPVATVAERSREQRLADALNRLMDDSTEVQASALVSLDGFTMASALPDGMHEDRVGAMSAAILGLGERAAVELGRGQLSQVFIEGDDGYVLLMAAGGRAVLTCLANSDAKLGLVIYDMRIAAQTIGEILG